MCLYNGIIEDICEMMRDGSGFMAHVGMLNSYGIPKAYSILACKY